MIQQYRRQTEIAYQELYQSVRLRQDPQVMQDCLDTYTLSRKKLMDYSKGLVERLEEKHG